MLSSHCFVYKMIINCDTTRFIYEVLEQDEYSFMFDNLVVLDIGCNIGAFSLWITSRAEVVHAVDLSTRNIELLNQTVKDNHIYNIKTHSCAIAGVNSARDVEAKGNAGSGGWRLRGSSEDWGGEKVDGYTLNTFMEKNCIPHADIVKLDVEGAEYEILQAKDFPVSKVSTITGEFHGADPTTILENLGYRCRVYGGHFLARR